MEPTFLQVFNSYERLGPTFYQGGEKVCAQFPRLELFTVGEAFGGWHNAQKTHFDDGGVFDQLYGK